jgi:hypothetical protein
MAKDVYKAERRFPAGVKEKLVEGDKDIAESVILPLSDKETKMVTKAVALLVKAGFPADKYPIFKVESEGIDLLGEASDCQKIHLTEEAFDRGMFDFVATLLEEVAHCHTKKGDFTRPFQDWIFRAVVKQVEARFDELL